MKNVQKTWENIHKKVTWGEYPESQLVSFVASKYYKEKDRTKIKFLDLGCGGGASTIFLAEQGFIVVGCDVSPEAVKLCRKRLKQKNLKAKISVHNFIDMRKFKKNTYDCVLDISVLQYNSYREIRSVIRNIHRILKKGSWFFGLMVADSARLKSGERGNVHFYTKTELKQLFQNFEDLYIGYVQQEHRHTKNKFWIVEARK